MPKALGRDKIDVGIGYGSDIKKSQGYTFTDMCG